jgi:hypothetical protein
VTALAPIMLRFQFLRAVLQQSTRKVLKRFLLTDIASEGTKATWSYRRGPPTERCGEDGDVKSVQSRLAIPAWSTDDDFDFLKTMRSLSLFILYSFLSFDLHRSCYRTHKLAPHINWRRYLRRIPTKRTFGPVIRNLRRTSSGKRGQKHPKQSPLSTTIE